MGGFWTNISNFLFIFVGASATKSFVRSRIFRYRLPRNVLNKGQKTWEGEGVQRPLRPPRPPMGQRVKYPWLTTVLITR